MNASLSAVVSPSRRLQLLSVVALLIALGTGMARAVVLEPTTYVWTGMGYGNWADDPGNWENDTPPPATPTPDNMDITDAILRFGDTRRTYVQFDELYAHRLEIVGNTRPYHFHSGQAETRV